MSLPAATSGCKPGQLISTFIYTVQPSLEGADKEGSDSGVEVGSGGNLGKGVGTPLFIAGLDGGPDFGVAAFATALTDRLSSVRCAIALHRKWSRQRSGSRPPRWQWRLNNGVQRKPCLQACEVFVYHIPNCNNNLT